MMPMWQMLLRLAVWGEPVEVAEGRLADWVDHLEEFGRDRSALAFARELITGVVAHAFFRLSDNRSVSVALPMVAVVVGAPLALLLAFAPYDIEFALQADVHLTGGVAVFALGLSRSPGGLASSRVRSWGLFISGSGLLHVLATTPVVDWDTVLLVVYLTASGFGLVLGAASASRSGLVLGSSRVVLVLCVGGFCCGALWHLTQAAVFGPNIFGFTSVAAAVVLGLLALGFVRMWVASRSSGVPAAAR